ENEQAERACLMPEIKYMEEKGGTGVFFAKSSTMLDAGCWMPSKTSANYWS
ncbi:MAG: hypothetical protein Q9184_007257, partial [Pyrenodesmia sp. 2 TL-2023]